MLQNELNQKPHLQKYLFDKGFLITTNKNINLEKFPFYGNWAQKDVGNYTIYFHKRAQIFTFQTRERTHVLIGHAYNPYSCEVDENVLLQEIAENYGKDNYYDILNEWTGVFFYGVIGNGKNEKIEFTLDASGQQYACYGRVKEDVFIASHMRLVGDIADMKTADYVERLVNYKWYHYMMGNYLPGDLTCYEELKRVIPNTYVKYFDNKFLIQRFYPQKAISMCETEEEYQAVIQQAASILQNTMELIVKKWNRPAISLTGGIDSNTTFAAAENVYEKYTTFSYVSLNRESVDSQKAKEISDKFGVQYREYLVPDSNNEVEDFTVYKAIFEHNDGNIGWDKDNEVRKKAVLIQSNVCDVEVKSWISETIRAYAYKYFGKTKFPKRLKPRHYTSLYKIFLANRKLVKETDNHFAEFLQKTNLKEHLFNYDETDFFVWEMMHGGKCGLDIGVMKSCFDITIPYNNRKLLDLLLRVPLEKRINDQHHLDLKKLMNKELYDMNIRVVNGNETYLRKKIIGAYFTLNSWLPF